MPTSHRSVAWSAREELLSSDLVRGQLLASKAVQDAAGSAAADGNGVPISSFDVVPSWTPTTGFSVTLGAGSGHQFSTSGVTSDDSNYQVLSWPATSLSFATPDPTNARIDLIVATPATVAQDLVARNVLLDPVARTQGMINVAKTSQPSATLAVVTGTPGATPVPPAVPAGATALYEVYVPAAAASSSAFPIPAPRLFRLAPFPWSVMSGIVSGCRLTWDLTADVSTTSSAISFGAGVSVVVIDGEVIDCSSLTGLAVTQDTSANPFGSAAGASDRPYYIYLVGGRHAPQASLGLGGLIPVAVVESLTPPNLATGLPTASIATSRGAASVFACLYIGLGFTVAGTTRRRPCIMKDDLTEIVGADFGGFMQLTKAGAGNEALGTPASKPVVSRCVFGQLSLGAASANGEAHLHPDQGDGAAPAPTSVGVGSLLVAPSVRMQVAAHPIYANVTFFFGSNPKIWVGGTSLAAGDVITFTPMAYDHRVRKFASLG